MFRPDDIVRVKSSGQVGMVQDIVDGRVYVDLDAPFFLETGTRVIDADPADVDEVEFAGGFDPDLRARTVREMDMLVVSVDLGAVSTSGGARSVNADAEGPAWLIVRFRQNGSAELVWDLRAVDSDRAGTREIPDATSLRAGIAAVRLEDWDDYFEPDGSGDSKLSSREGVTWQVNAYAGSLCAQSTGDGVWPDGLRDLLKTLSSYAPVDADELLG